MLLGYDKKVKIKKTEKYTEKRKKKQGRLQPQLKDKCGMNDRVEVKRKKNEDSYLKQRNR